MQILNKEKVAQQLVGEKNRKIFKKTPNRRQRFTEWQNKDTEMHSVFERLRLQKHGVRPGKLDN